MGTISLPHPHHGNWQPRLLSPPTTAAPPLPCLTTVDPHRAVTYIGEIEGESQQEPERESTVTCRYIGEGNMGHMGLTLWALTPPFKLKVEAEDLKH